MKKILVYVGILMLMVMPMFAARAGVNETYVARISDTGYATIKAAFEAAQNGETIEVLKNAVSEDDLHLGDGVTLEIPATATLTFNGYVTVSSTSKIINEGMIAVGGTLKMDNIPSDGTSGYIRTTDDKISIKSTGTVHFPNKWYLGTFDFATLKTVGGEWEPTNDDADSILKFNLEKNAKVIIDVQSFVYLGENTDDEGTNYDNTKWKGAITIGENHYTNINKAFEAAEDSDTIKLLSDVRMGSASAIDGNRNITLDLNNHNLNLTGTNARITIENASVNVIGKGSITNTQAATQAFVLYGSSQSTDENYSVLTIGKDVTVTAQYSIRIDNNNGNNYGNVVNLYGKLYGLDNKASTGIFVDGPIDATTGAVNKVNIFPNSAIITKGANSKGIAAFGYVDWKIDGAIISGTHSGIAIKAGKFNIKNSTIKCEGADLTPTNAINTTKLGRTYYSDINGSGAAIQIESNTNNPGQIELTIESGVFESKNSATIYEYVDSVVTTSSVERIIIKGGTFKSDANKEVFMLSEKLVNNGTQYVSGGLFDSNPTKFLVEGYRTYVNSDGMFAISKITVATGTSTISGNVMLPAGTTAVVHLRQGATILKTVELTEDNDYEFLNVADGEYNISVVGTNSTVMKAIKVDGENVELDIELPVTGSQEVIIAGANTPPVVVKGLDIIDPGTTVETTIELVDNNASDNSELEAIKELEKTNKSFLFLDITLTIDDSVISDLDGGALEFLIPFTDTNATNLKMYRYHGAEVQALTALTALPDDPIDGTFYFDKEEKVIHVYAGKFSLYGVTYTGTGNPNTNDNVGVYALMALISIISITSVVLVKKRFN